MKWCAFVGQIDQLMVWD